MKKIERGRQKQRARVRARTIENDGHMRRKRGRGAETERHMQESVEDYSHIVMYSNYIILFQWYWP